LRYKNFIMRLMSALLVASSAVPAVGFAADVATVGGWEVNETEPSSRPTSEAPSGAVVDLPDDVLQVRVRSELREFTDWLAANKVRGVIGEVGWPDNSRGDAERWNAVAEAWYRDADAAGLWVTYWDAGESRTNYPLAAYKPTAWLSPTVSVVDTQARVIEAHPSTTSYQRGVYLATAVRPAPWRDEVTSAFSNTNPGQYGVDYKYDEGSTFQFLAGRGIGYVTIGFRWERLQPELGEPLDQQELAYLKEAVESAEHAGLHVVLQPFNKAAYYRSDGERGTRLLIGPTSLTRSYFNDLWIRLSDEFRDDPTVIAYGLMNEPAASVRPETWERTSQEAVTAIRANGDAKLILVPGARWSKLREWTSTHPRAWISDPLDNFRYEAHHYFDHDATGTYVNRYAEDLQAAQAAGYGAVAAAAASQPHASGEARGR
jgi:hypothetical protein